MSSAVSQFKEFMLNAIGLTLINIDMDAELSDKIMEKTEKWFWFVVVYVAMGIISYLI